MSQQDSKSASILPNGCGCLLLLMGIGVIGAAIALPPFLYTSNNYRPPEAKNYVSSMNKGQQAYFAENSVFGTSVEALGLGIKTETTNFKYSVSTSKKAAFNYGVSKQKEFKSYVGGVFVVSVKDGSSTTRILCIADSPGTIKPPEPTNQNGKIACGTGTTEVTK
ncbi:MAG: type IV pilin-like G/H family protein [Microcoleus sp.]